jgi:hypothetical protein
MTRDILAVLLCLVALGAGLATAFVQSENNAEAFELDEIRSECRMMEAVNNVHSVDVLTLDWAPGAGEELAGDRAGELERWQLEAAQ